MSKQKVIGIKSQIKEVGSKGYRVNFLSDLLQPEGFLLSLNPRFKEKVKNIRKQFEKGKPGSSFLNYKLLENPALKIEIEKLRKEFGLSKGYRDFLIEYIITDDFIPSSDIEGLVLEVTVDNNAELEYNLKLTKNTTLSEIKRAWTLIEKELKSKRGRSKPWKNFSRDSEIYFLKRGGKNTAEIYNIMFKKGVTGLNFKTIKKVVYNLKKKIENPSKT